MTSDINTEEKIIKAATDVFIKKGFAGARMREIADHAQINKGLLHYYFKSKQALFESIFFKSLHSMLSHIYKVLSSDIPFMEKIDYFVESYMNFLLANPRLPLFVVSELSRDPQHLIAAITKKKALSPNIYAFKQSFEQAVLNKEIKPMDFRQLIINTISLSVFPFVAKNMVQTVLDLSDQEFQKILMERKKIVKTFIKKFFPSLPKRVTE